MSEEVEEDTNPYQLSTSSCVIEQLWVRKEFQVADELFISVSDVPS